MHALIALIALGGSPPPSPPDAEPTAAPVSSAPDPRVPSGVDEQVRDILVTTDALDSSNPFRVFRHPGTRKVVTEASARETGASSVSDLLQATPAVRVVEGNAGLGSVSTKLNVAARGVNPRFSSRTAVLLDEVPIATAPYGRPQLALFPLSLYTVHRVDVSLGGTSLRFGPHTSGGVINIVSRPIPKTDTLQAFVQHDQWGGSGAGASFGGTRGKLGVYTEYAPRAGRDFRRHSDFRVHGGLAKLEYRFRPRADLTSTSHFYSEDIEIPGGLPVDAYERDPRQSVRLHDRFSGWRMGTSLKLRVRPDGQQALQVITYFHHTDRVSEIAEGVTGQADTIRLQPRIYDAAGLEPRYTLRLRHRSGAFHDLAFGARLAYEVAEFLGSRKPLAPAGVTRPISDDRARIVASAGYLEDQLFLLDADLVLTGGVRAEVVAARREDRFEDALATKTYWAPLPAASIWYGPWAHLGVFAGYGRSFGPPQFLQLSVAEKEGQFRPEYANTAELGTKLRGLAGFDGRSTLWLKAFSDLTDVSLDHIEQPGDTLAWGVENELSWRSVGRWKHAPGWLATAAHAYTNGRVTTGVYQGNTLPWYPTHSLSGGLRYEFTNGIYLGADVRHDGEYFTDYANTGDADATGGVGIVPAYTVYSAQTGFRAEIARGRVLAFGIGVRNLTDAARFSRTDDRNIGILPLTPRTVFLNLAITQQLRRSETSS